MSDLNVEKNWQLFGKTQFSFDEIKLLFTE